MSHRITTESVTLDGYTYVVRNNAVEIAALDTWGDSLRVIGNKRRADRRLTSQWVQEDWGAGLGFYTHRGEVPNDQAEGHPSYRGFFDSSSETRWAGQVTLPALDQSATRSVDALYSRLFTLSDREVRAVPTSNTAVSIFNSSTDNWDQDYDLSGYSANWVSQDFVELSDGDYLLMGRLLTVAAGTYPKLSGGSWSDFSPSTDVSNAVYSAVRFHGILYAATNNTSGGDNIIIEQSTDDGDNWSQITGMEVNAGIDIIELIEYFDASGQAALYLHCGEGLFLLDFANQALTKVIEFSDAPGQQSFFGFKTASWNGRLYLARKTSLLEMTPSGQYRDVSPFALGRVPDRFVRDDGHIDTVKATDGWLFIGMYCGDSDTGSIWAYDGTGWHYIWEGSEHVRDIAFLQESGGDRGTVLHFVTDSGVFHFKNHILSNPQTVSGFEYESTGKLITPYFTGGMAEVDSTLIALAVTSEGLDTEANDNEKITTNIDTDFEDSFGNTLTFYSDNNTLQKYASGAGVSARAVRVDYRLNRGSTNTNSPVMFYPVLHYEKLFPNVYSYTFEIDVRKTAQNEHRFASEDDVMKQLLTTREKIPLVSFESGGTNLFGSHTRYVRVTEMPSVTREPYSATSSEPGIDNAFIQVRLEERL